MVDGTGEQDADPSGSGSPRPSWTRTFALLAWCGLAISDARTLAGRLADPPFEATFSDLARSLEHDKPVRLSRALGRLTRRGFLERLIQVRSPSGRRIGRFRSVCEIPEVVIDPETGEPWPPSIQDVHLVYRLPVNR